VRPTTLDAQLDELERQYQGQLLGLGAIALEMHQSGELDESSSYQLRTSAATLMRLAAEAAETERELRSVRPTP
jgi:hypothetical protein